MSSAVLAALMSMSRAWFSSNLRPSGEAYPAVGRTDRRSEIARDGERPSAAAHHLARLRMGKQVAASTSSWIISSTMLTHGPFRKSQMKVLRDRSG